MQRLAISLACLAAAAMAAQWKPIQPEAGLAGWSRVSIPPAGKLDGNTPWSVRPFGDLLCDATKDTGHEWFRYDREVKDFVFYVEWRFFEAEGTRGYHSGIFVRNSRDGSDWYKVQAGAPNEGGFFVFNEKVNGVTKPVTLRDPSKTLPVRDPGEWNNYEIRAEGKHIKLKINGEAAGEFDCPRLSGYIGLEADHYKVEFRNMRIQELP